MGRHERYGPRYNPYIGSADSLTAVYSGDGLDDFVCIAPGGELSVAINRGNFVFEYTGAGKYKSSEGYLQARIHLADVDGDGRFDYCAARDNGDVQCWRNGGRCK